MTMTRFEKSALVVLLFLIAGTFVASLLKRPDAIPAYDPEGIIEAPYYEKDSLEALNWMRLSFLDSLEKDRIDSVVVPYRQYFVECADSIGWDWRMLAALCYHESRFDLNALSHRGATGLMQVTPPTAAHFGIYDLHDPRQNIMAGALNLKNMIWRYRELAADEDELFKFIMAAYNAGAGRIKSCFEFAEERGIEIHYWDEIVALIPDMEDFKGMETIEYVDTMEEVYEMFRKIK